MMFNYNRREIEVMNDKLSHFKYIQVIATKIVQCILISRRNNKWILKSITCGLFYFWENFLHPLFYSSQFV